MSERVVGYDGGWVPQEQDPRAQASPVGELATLRQYLDNYRRTLRMKCDGLDAEQLATRSVPPSDLSLLGLVRHLARVEHAWFERVLRGGLTLDKLYWTAEQPDLDIDGAVGDPAVMADAFREWEVQIAAANAWLDGAVDLDAMVPTPRGGTFSVRDILVHMVEEYARHCGHADLLRECIDGRTGA